MDEHEVLDWMIKQKEDESIEEIDREKLYKYIETKEFLAVVFCKFSIQMHVSSKYIFASFISN